jgi:hypothetical protein
MGLVTDHWRCRAWQILLALLPAAEFFYGLFELLDALEGRAVFAAAPAALVRRRSSLEIARTDFCELAGSCDRTGSRRAIVRRSR